MFDILTSIERNQEINLARSQVCNLFAIVLKRQPTKNELDFWVYAIVDKKQTLSQLQQSLTKSVVTATPPVPVAPTIQPLTSPNAGVGNTGRINLEKELTELMGKINDARKEIVSLNNQIAPLRDESKVLEAEDKTLSTQIADNTAEVTSLQRDNNMLMQGLGYYQSVFDKFVTQKILSKSSTPITPTTQPLAPSTPIAPTTQPLAPSTPAPISISYQHPLISPTTSTAKQISVAEYNELPLAEKKNWFPVVVDILHPGRGISGYVFLGRERVATIFTEV